MDGNNRFGPTERALLLGVKRVGPTVIVQLVASMLGSTCWQNSPQARSAIDGAIALARAHLAADATNGVNG